MNKSFFVFFFTMKFDRPFFCVFSHFLRTAFLVFCSTEPNLKYDIPKFKLVFPLNDKKVIFKNIFLAISQYLFKDLNFIWGHLVEQPFFSL